MAGEVTFTLREADLLASYREAFRHWLLRRKVIVGHMVFLAMLFVLALAIRPNCYCQPLAERMATEAWFVGTVAAVIAFLYGYYYWVMTSSRTRHAYRQMNFLRRPQSLAWSDDGIVQQTAHGTGTYAWEDLRRWSELPSNILLYYGDRPEFIVPQRELTSEQISDLRSTLAASPLARA